jgi:hypothetical protein
MNRGLMQTSPEELKTWRAGVVDINNNSGNREDDIPTINGVKLGGLQAVRARAKYSAREAAEAQATKDAVAKQQKA